VSRCRRPGPIGRETCHVKPTEATVSTTLLDVAQDASQTSTHRCASALAQSDRARPIAQSKTSLGDMKIYDLTYNALPPDGIEHRIAHIVGGGIAGLAAASTRRIGTGPCESKADPSLAVPKQPTVYPQVQEPVVRSHSNALQAKQERHVYRLCRGNRPARRSDRMTTLASSTTARTVLGSTPILLATARSDMPFRDKRTMSAASASSKPKTRRSAFRRRKCAKTVARCTPPGAHPGTPHDSSG